jgi:hypothetical protein
LFAIPPAAHVTYRLEKHTCGQARCRKCRAGGPDAGHGPYWYAYWHRTTSAGGKKLTSRYLGKTLPQNAAAQQGEGSSPGENETVQALAPVRDRCTTHRKEVHP